MPTIPYRFLRAPSIHQSRRKAAFVFGIVGYDEHIFLLQIDATDALQRDTINGTIMLEGPCRQVVIGADGSRRVDIMPRAQLGSEDINPMRVPGARDPRYGLLTERLRSSGAAVRFFETILDAILLPVPPSAPCGVDTALAVLGAVATLSADREGAAVTAEVRGDHCVAHAGGGDVPDVAERLQKACNLLGFDGGRAPDPRDTIPLARRRTIPIPVALPSAHARMSAAATLRNWVAQAGGWATEAGTPAECAGFVHSILAATGSDHGA